MNDTAVTPPAELAPEDAPSPPVDAPSTARDAQRNALAELLDLLRLCARAEADLEQDRRGKIEAVDKDLDRSRLQADHQLSTQSQELSQKHHDRLTELNGKHDFDAANLTEADRVRRVRVIGEFDAIARDARKQLDHAVWLADSVGDGTQAKAKSDARKAREESEQDELGLDELQEKINATLGRYSFHVPTDTPPDPEVDQQSPATEQFQLRRKAVEDLLEELKKLSLPRLLVGVAPWGLGLILLAACGLIGRLGLAGTLAPWQALAAGLGTGVLLIVIAGVVISMLARRQILRTYVPLRSEMRAARACAELKLTQSKARLDSMVKRALQQREVEIRAAKDRAEPALSRGKGKHDDAIAALDRELKAKLLHVDEKRDKQVAEAEAAYNDATAQLRSRIDQDLAAATERHQRGHTKLDAEYNAARAALLERWNIGLRQVQQNIATGGSEPASALADFSVESIARWSAPTAFPSAVRFGQLEVDAQQLLSQLPQETPFTLDLPSKFDLPAVLALPRQASLIIQADRAGRPAAIATLQMLMTRLLTSIPAGRAKFTIIDPVALGQNFAGFMHLADYDESLVASRIWTDPDHIEQRLTDLTEHMETVIQKYLRNEFKTIDDYNRQAGELAEPYRFLVISDFPHGFQPDSLRRLASIASTGARCGVYTLIFRDTRQVIPNGVGFDDVEAHSVNLVQSGARFVWKDDVFAQFPLTLDPPPAEEQLTHLMHTVGKLAREANRVEVSFKAIAPQSPQFWTMSAKSELRVPIGRMGATRHQTLRLGRGVAQHALVAGKTGSGKSTLLHAIITNIAMWYSPDEVELYLIDFKKGVEFKAYAAANLPHARAIAVESDREFGLSVLQRIDAEMTRRGEMFRKLGVQDLASYRDTVAKESDEATERRSDAGKGETLDSKPSPFVAPSLSRSVALPRILLIIDEFQEFFSEDDKLGQDAALLIDRLVRQGRAFGIHVLLGSQTIGGSSGLSRATLGQMAVRIALQCTEADSQLILGDNNSAARLLTRPGEAIYNDAGGLVEGNSPFQVAWLPDAQRDGFLDEVNQKLSADGIVRPPLPIVFEGNAPADVRKNEPLAQIIAGRIQPPVPIAYLGEPVAIKDPTAILFRRQAGSNALIVGQGEEQALAMFTSAVLSLSSSLRGREARFVILDGTPADSPFAGRLASLKSYVRHRYDLIDYRTTAEAVGEVASELKRRHDADDANAAPIFVFIFGLQRYRVLRKTDDGFSFGSSEEKPPSPDKQFSEILREGPAFGVHVVAWADTAVSVDRTIERNLVREFDNRVLMQMSATDSSTLIDSPAANKLGFFRAISYSEEQGTIEKFRPYALPPTDWLDHLSR